MHKACVVAHQQVDSVDVVVASPQNNLISQVIFGGENVAEIPKNFGEKFPKLKIFWLYKSPISVVRNFTFKNMENLLDLRFVSNKITTIESYAFDGLVNVRTLRLSHNLIEVLVENIFAPMIELRDITLEDNKLRVLSPAVFQIPGGKLENVNLNSNVCISAYYYKKAFVIHFERMAKDIKEKCSRSEE